jgi:hypothetical protein
MLTRSSGFLTLRSGPTPGPVDQLQSDGSGEEIAALRADVERVFDEYPPDERGDTPEQSTPFRYEMLNRSGVVQQAIPCHREHRLVATVGQQRPPGTLLAHRRRTPRSS